MSRQVPFDRPLSDEDREYLHARGLHARVEQMDADFPPDGEESAAEVTGDEDTGDTGGEPRPDWESMTKDQLLAEIDRVNSEYEVDPPLAKDGTKSDVLARLTEWWDKE